jgi:hypothetical protein
MYIAIKGITELTAVISFFVFVFDTETEIISETITKLGRSTQNEGRGTSHENKVWGYLNTPLMQPRKLISIDV